MLIILDRDGVINEDSDDYIKTPEEWIPIPGSLEAISTLNRAGHLVVVATNQSGIARGLYTEAGLAKIHQRMQDALAQVGGHIDAIFYCPHHPDTHCHCRKPKAGLLQEIAKKYHTDFKDAVMIGDAVRDIACAKTAGCPAILVRTGKGKLAANIETLSAAEVLTLQDVPIFEDLAAVVASLCRS
jgi:D-glycero-D-manno-heptose 1,7-bisphosphate phosphatase